MAVSTGISLQWGMATESTWGTPVTVTRFLPIVSETMEEKNTRVESKAIYAGYRVLETVQSVATDIEVAGMIQTELYGHAQGLLWSHALGGAAISGPAGSIYTQTYTVGDLTGKSFTSQLGRPDVGGTVRPFTYGGCKISKWQLAAKVGEIVTFGYDITARHEVTGSSLVTAAYPGTLPTPMTYVGGAITIGGSAAAVKSFTLNGDNKLNMKRRFLGSAYIAEQLEADLREYGGTLDMEFSDLTQLNRYKNNTVAAVVGTFAVGSETAVITMPNCRFDSGSPKQKGRDVYELPVTFKPLAVNGSGAITVVTTNTDSAA